MKAIVMIQKSDNKTKPVEKIREKQEKNQNLIVKRNQQMEDVDFVVKQRKYLKQGKWGSEHYNVDLIMKR